VEAQLEQYEPVGTAVSNALALLRSANPELRATLLANWLSSTMKVGSPLPTVFRHMVPATVGLTFLAFREH